MLLYEISVEKRNVNKPQRARREKTNLLNVFLQVPDTALSTVPLYERLDSSGVDRDILFFQSGGLSGLRDQVLVGYGHLLLCHIARHLKRVKEMNVSRDEWAGSVPV